MKCCICGNEITNPWGNNPCGSAWLKDGKIVRPTFNSQDRCCDDCNAKYVIAGRMLDAMHLSPNEVLLTKED